MINYKSGLKEYRLSNEYEGGSFQNKSSLIVTYIIVQLLLLMIACVYFFGVINNINFSSTNFQRDAKLLSFFNLFAYFWCFFTWYTIRKELFSPYLIFLTSSFFFNCGQVLVFYFNFVDREQLMVFNRLAENVLIKTLAFQYLCIITIHVGGLIALMLDSNQKSDKNVTVLEEQQMYDHTMKVMRSVGKIILAITCIPLMYFMFKQYDFRLASTYSVEWYSIVSSSFGGYTIFDEFFKIGILTMLIAFRDNVKNQNFIIALAIIYSFCWYIIGVRNQTFIMMIGVTWILLMQKRIRFKFSKVILASIFIGYIIPLGYHLRHMELGEVSNLENLIDLILQINPIADVLTETGGSLRTVGYTISLVPDYIPYTSTYVYNILHVFIPQTILQVIGIEAPIYLNAGTWMTQLMNTTNSTPSGEGFSFIAEAYLNYGSYGFLAMFILGIFLTKISLWGTKAFSAKKPLTILITTYIFTIFLFYARSESYLMVVKLKYIIYIGIFIYFIGRFTIRKKAEQLKK